MTQIIKKIAKISLAIFVLSFFTFIFVSPAYAASSGDTVASTDTTSAKQQKSLARQELRRVYVQGIHSINQAANEAIKTIGTQFRIMMQSATTSTERTQIVRARNQAIREVIKAKQDGLRQIREGYLEGLREINSQ
ncbi:MAG: hypothetical protein M1429_01940 [Patescibacteria group bacterium]|nr:hypothetical protein [Patescibacteria group bacterium]